MFTQAITNTVATALLAFSVSVNAFTTPCLFQQYQCGSNLVDNHGYNITEFTAAVLLTAPIPPLDANQLLNVLYRCTNITGGIAGNSYCISGCIGMEDLADDQCAK